MIKLFSAILIISFYTSCLYVYLKHIHYFNSLFKRTSKFKQSSYVFSRYRSIHARVAPSYRKEYFGYDYFVLPDINNTILSLHRYFTVFGIVRPYTECLIIYKDDIVKSIICLEDKRYGEKVTEDLRVTYRNTIIVITGGILLWKIGLMFSIF